MPSLEMAGHPTSRRLCTEAEQTIKQLVSVGVAPRQILAALRSEHPSALVTAKTVYNAKAQQRREVLAGRSPIQALLDKLKESNYQHTVECNANGNVQRLFFAHLDSITLAWRYSSVLLMDCIYKMNRFHMPLLVVIGRTGLNTTFFISFAFLEEENTTRYIWALTQLKNLFTNRPFPAVFVTDADLALANAIVILLPECCHLLCLWHIDKNVLAKCKTLISNKEQCDVLMKA